MSRPAVDVARWMVLACVWAIISQPSNVSAQQPPVRMVRSGFPALLPPGAASDSTGGSTSAWQIDPTAGSNDRPVDSGSGKDSWLGNAITVGSSLAIVLTLFFASVWIFRSVTGRSKNQPVAAGVLQPIGGYRLDARTDLTLLRCGRRVLLICQTAASTTTLAEFTDADEVAALLAQCDGKSRLAFEKTLEAIGRDKHAPGFVDLPVEKQVAPPRPAPRTLFQTA